MSKTKLTFGALLLGASLHTASASELFIEAINPVTGEVMLIPDPGSCPTEPVCLPPMQELETEEDEGDNG